MQLGANGFAQIGQGLSVAASGLSVGSGGAALTSGGVIVDGAAMLRVLDGTVSATASTDAVTVSQAGSTGSVVMGRLATGTIAGNAFLGVTNGVSKFQVRGVRSCVLVNP